MTSRGLPRLVKRCVCDWPRPPGCSGTGTEYCKGCGGDLCVCVCGGERECSGCDACSPLDHPEPAS